MIIRQFDYPQGYQYQVKCRINIYKINFPIKFQIYLLSGSEVAKPFMTLYGVQGKYRIDFPLALKG